FSNPRSTPEDIVASLDNSLRQLDTDHVDVYQLHGVPPHAYDHALNDLAPVLLREKAKGKFRHLGISETAPHDPEHQVVQRGVQVVLFGTRDPEHLRTNSASIRKPPLPDADRQQLATLFGHLVGVGLDAPHLSRPRASS